MTYVEQTYGTMAHMFRCIRDGDEPEQRDAEEISVIQDGDVGT